jgi:AraC-like DNA-binding protein
MRKRSAQKLNTDLRVHWLDKVLWDSAGLMQRSRELTPLYIERYAGPRSAPEFSAHSFWEITWIFQGGGEVQADGVFSFCEGTAILIPPGVLHRESSKAKVDSLWIGIEGTLLRSMEKPRAMLVRDTGLNPIFKSLWLHSQHRAGRIGPILDGLVRVMMSQFFRSYSEGNESASSQIAHAVAFLRRHYREKITIPQLSQKFGYSEGHFYREFKRYTGCSPIGYLTDIRIGHASHWLQNSLLPVAEIADMVGFPDALYFSRVFKKATGCGPTKFRKYRPA